MRGSSEVIRIRGPKGVTRAVGIAARLSGLSSAEWASRAIQSALLGQGVIALPYAANENVTTIAERDADLSRDGAIEFCRRSPSGSVTWSEAR